MKSKGSKIAIIVVSIILIIALIAGIMTYLFIATDLFRSDKELFSKYAMQNIDVMKQLMNSETINTYKDLENNDTYDSLTTLKLENSEGGEVSNPLNDLSLQITTQKDEGNEYFYADGQILFQNEKYLEAELIRTEELAGIRFVDVVKEFVTIRDDENLEVVAEVLGLETEQLQAFIQTVQGSEEALNEVISKEEIAQTKEKYTNILKNGIANATFSSLKKATITVNTDVIQANAYTAHLSKEQTRQIIIEILNNIKSDEVILSKTRNFIDDEVLGQEIDETIASISADENIPEMRITVYEQKGTTVQTIIEIGKNKISIENAQNDNQVNVKILFKDEAANEQIIQITKNNTENSENYRITMNKPNAEQETAINISNEMTKDAEKINTSFRVEYVEGIKIVAAEINNNTAIGEIIENQHVLNEDNNVVLNDINKDLLAKAIESLNTRILSKTTASIMQLQEKIDLENEQIQNDEAESQIDINKFNAKFEFYTGSEVSAENVKTLLDIVKDNLNSIEYIPSEQEDVDAGINSEDVLNIKLNIEENRENVELINSTLEDIKDDKTYKVSISYKEDTGIIDYITVEEIKGE